MTYRIVFQSTNSKDDLHVVFINGFNKDDAILRGRRSDPRFNFGNADVIEVSVARNQREAA